MLNTVNNYNNLGVDEIKISNYITNYFKDKESYIIR